MDIFKDISSATASRDIAKGIALGWLVKSGDKNQSIYQFI